MKNVILIMAAVLIAVGNMYGQFGRNKVQYKGFTWYYIQSKHFDVYFNQESRSVIEFAAQSAEEALGLIELDMNYRINNRIALIVYSSQNDFQETNVISQYLPEGVGGFTELFKNRVVVPFVGDYGQFHHVIHHELVHAVVNDMFYGGSLQNLIGSSNAVQFPMWMSEGLPEFLSLGMDTHTDMFIREAAVSEYLPDLAAIGGYFSYRAGQSVMYYIAKTYGREKIGELMNQIKSKGSVEGGIQASIGLKLEELNERWKKYVKETYWPDVARFEDPEDFSKRLTESEPGTGTYNTSPTISPRGDKILFISNRDFYFDIYVMDANDGDDVERMIEGNRSINFEELNILTPGLTWSPDGRRFAVGAKTSGFDVVHIFTIEDEEIETLPFQFDGVGSVDWSKDGTMLTFQAQVKDRSDIYVYYLETGELINLTNDIYSDGHPAFSNDNKFIFFSSDREQHIERDLDKDDYFMRHIAPFQRDLYVISVEDQSMQRLTDNPHSSEVYPIPSPDGTELLFISDMNGINNIYRKPIVLPEDGSVEAIIDLEPTPVTNSITGIDQASISLDGKKLAFSALYEAKYNIFTMNNPFNVESDTIPLPDTKYMAALKSGTLDIEMTPREDDEEIVSGDDEKITFGDITVFGGQVIDSTKSYGDSVAVDYSNYIFGEQQYYMTDTSETNENEEFQLEDNLDDEGNYVVNKYRITFSPDLVYANAGYSTYYGLMGTTILSFSDMLGDHRLIGVTSLQVDLKNSDYGLAYYYLPGRIDWGVQAFHTARFLYLDAGNRTNLHRFRNYGIAVTGSYPISRFDRFDFGLSFLNVSTENLDDNDPGRQQSSFLVTSASLVHDNTIWGYTSPIDGTRYRLDFLANPIVDYADKGFYSIMGDYRSYNRFFYDHSFVYRFSFGTSGGPNPQRFFLGGIENWINRKWATGRIPVDDPADFAFLSSALPLRGYYYSEQIGSKYALMNLELRFPLIRYLLTGGLPLLFQNILGVAFVDVGTAWENTSKLQLFSQTPQGNLQTEDLLIGTGVGARMFFLYFLLRFDVGWAYNVDHFSKPIYYFSIGTDF